MRIYTPSRLIIAVSNMLSFKSRSPVHRKIYLGILSIVVSSLTLFSEPIHASKDKSYFEFSVGMSQLNIANYNKPLFKQISIGTKINDLIIEGGLMDIEPFEILAEPSNYISVKGFSFRGLKPIVLSNKFMIAPGFGIYRWDANVYRYNNKAGNDSGFSSQFFAVMDYQFNDYFALRASASYLREVSGSNIKQLSIGLLLSY